MIKSLGVTGAVCIVLGIIGLAVVPSIYGLYLAFKASIILGIVALIVEPSPAILGWIAILGRNDVCQKLAEWMHLPF